jgi:hypothetical protein
MEVVFHGMLAGGNSIIERVEVADGKPQTVLKDIEQLKQKIMRAEAEGKHYVFSFGSLTVNSRYLEAFRISINAPRQ